MLKGKAQLAQNMYYEDNGKFKSNQSNPSIPFSFEHQKISQRDSLSQPDEMEQFEEEADGTIPPKISNQISQLNQTQQLIHHNAPQYQTKEKGTSMKDQRSMSQVQPKNQNIQILSNTGSIILNNSTIEENKNQSAFSQSELMQMVVTSLINPGDMFGEASLVYNGLRGETVYALEKSTFVSLSKIDFMHILKSKPQKLIQRGIDFLSKIFCFTNLSFDQLQLLYMGSLKASFKFGDQIFSEGDISKNVFIVQTGQFAIFQNYTSTQRDEDNNQISIDVNEPGNSQDLYNLSIKKLQNQNSLQPKSTQHKVKIIQSYELFGEEDILKDRRRTYSVECASNFGQLIMIRNDIFRDKIMTSSQCQLLILQRLETQLNDMQERCKLQQQSLNQYHSFLMEDRAKTKMKMQQEKNSNQFQSPSITDSFCNALAYHVPTLDVDLTQDKYQVFDIKFKQYLEMCQGKPPAPTQTQQEMNREVDEIYKGKQQKYDPFNRRRRVRNPEDHKVILKIPIPTFRPNLQYEKEKERGKKINLQNDNSFTGNFFESGIFPIKIGVTEQWKILKENSMFRPNYLQSHLDQEKMTETLLQMARQGAGLSVDRAMESQQPQEATFFEKIENIQKIHLQNVEQIKLNQLQQAAERSFYQFSPSNNQNFNYQYNQNYHKNSNQYILGGSIHSTKNPLLQREDLRLYPLSSRTSLDPIQTSLRSPYSPFSQNVSPTHAISPTFRQKMKVQKENLQKFQNTSNIIDLDLLQINALDLTQKSPINSFREGAFSSRSQNKTFFPLQD